MKKDFYHILLAYGLRRLAFIPRLASEPDPVTTIFGVDLTQSLLAGLTAMGSTVASLLVIYRSLKGKVTKLGTDTDGFLRSMKDKLEMLVTGEMEMQDFVTEITTSIVSMKDVLTNTIPRLESRKRRAEIGNREHQRAVSDIRAVGARHQGIGKEH